MAADKDFYNNFQDLKTKREAMGLSLKDVYQQTRVSVSYLQAIENSDFSALPEPAYARNFIKTYARALGVEETLILARYEEYINSLKMLDDMETDESAGGEGFFASMFTYYRKILGVIFVLLVIFSVMWLVSMQYRPSSRVDVDRSIMSKNINIASEKQDISEEGTSDELPVLDETQESEDAFDNKSLAPVMNAEQSQHLTSAEILAKKANTPLTDNVYEQYDDKDISILVIKANEATWIKMKIDQKPSFQILLQPGEKVEYKAVVFDIDIGNAGGVELQFKGKKIENLGKPGEVIRLRLP
ncbi:MAG: helix-turn-helix domain-containing protein [Syntrophaceae bacterium]|nr:helix-turn-helix domain-containing protein [Syntrophaceae bacterium]